MSQQQKKRKMKIKKQKSSIIWKSYWPLQFYAMTSLSSKFQIIIDDFIKFVDFPCLKFISDYLKISQNATVNREMSLYTAISFSMQLCYFLSLTKWKAAVKMLTNQAFI